MEETKTEPVNKHPQEIDLEMVHFQSSNLKDGNKQIAAVFLDSEGKEYEYTQAMNSQAALNMAEQYAKCTKVVGYKNPRTSITHFYWPNSVPKPTKTTEEIEVEQMKNEDLTKLKAMECASEVQ